MVILTEEEKELIRRIIKHEEEHGMPWEWWQVNIHPAKIMSLVDKGLIAVEGRGKRLRYRLALSHDMLRELVSQ